MSFSIGIIGLPNVGKSTLFKALTKKPVDIAAYPFTTIHPNIGAVTVPDERLLAIAKVIKPEKVTLAVIEFVDIAGLVKGAHRGEGLGNQFLSYIRNCDAIIEVVRAFSNPNIEHVMNEINPERDIEIIKTELLMKDFEILENLLKKLERETKDKKILKRLDFLRRIKTAVSQEKLISELDLTKEEQAEIKEYQFLTAKPFFYLFNFSKEELSVKEKLVLIAQKLSPKALLVDLKFEEELTEFPEEEARQLRDNLVSPLESIIINCYNILDLITFYTVAGGKETKSWALKRGSKVLEAGGIIHSDFRERFIRAEVIPWENLIKATSWHIAREKGWLKTVGKDYIVQDGDVIEFKI